MDNIENLEYWYSEYELRQFIEMAIQYDIDSVYNNRRQDNPWSLFFKPYVVDARKNYDFFCSQLNKKLTETTNWKAIEVDLKDRFLPMIEQYQEWYNNNESQTKKFDPYNPYKNMLSIMKSTKHEILKYFPDPPHQRKEKKKEFTTLFEAFIDPIKHQRILNILVNKQLCNTGNNCWIDTKEKLIDLFRYLHKQGYLSRKLTHNEMIIISKNTFAVDVSKSTLRPKPGKVDFPYIPIASTLS
jgi:hypothetical protein